MLRKKNSCNKKKESSLVTISLIQKLFGQSGSLLQYVTVFMQAIHQLQYKQLFRTTQNKTPIEFFRYLDCFAMLNFPIGVSLARYQNRNVKDKIKYFFLKLFGKEQDVYQGTGNFRENGQSLQEIECRQRAETNPEYFLYNISRRVRLGIILSILQGVTFSAKQQKLKQNGMMIEIDQEKDSTQKVNKNHKSFNVDHDMESGCRAELSEKFLKKVKKSHTLLVNTEDEFYNETNKLKVTKFCVKKELINNLNKLVFIEMNFIQYAPSLFQQLQDMDETIDVQQAFNLQMNLKGMNQFSDAGDGGKSGEFFYFSYDNKLLIKTLTEDELKTMLSILPDYFEHLQKNPNSLIAKILGIYKFVRQGKEESVINVMIMRNVASIPSKYIMRTYDMKGSTHDRQVLKDYNEIKSEKIGKVLKDLDFQELEGYVKIDQEQSSAIKKILVQDSIFFKKHNLMDYSLLVMKIDLVKYAQDKKLGLEQVMKELYSNQFMVVKSSKDELYYAVGIIDYLQEWNLGKSLEKNAKKLLKRDLNLDTSAQDPEVYQERFVTNLIDRIYK